MWLPTPVYESLPYVYVGIGILLIAGANYIGLDSRESTVYLGTGSASVLSGVFVYLRRSIARTKHKDSTSDGESAAE